MNQLFFWLIAIVGASAFCAIAWAWAIKTPWKPREILGKRKPGEAPLIAGALVMVGFLSAGFVGKPYQPWLTIGCFSLALLFFWWGRRFKLPPPKTRSRNETRVTNPHRWT